MTHSDLPGWLHAVLPRTRYGRPIDYGMVSVEFDREDDDPPACVVDATISDVLGRTLCWSCGTRIVFGDRYWRHYRRPQSCDAMTAKEHWDVDGVVTKEWPSVTTRSHFRVQLRAAEVLR